MHVSILQCPMSALCRASRARMCWCQLIQTREWIELATDYGSKEKKNVGVPASRKKSF